MGESHPSLEYLLVACVAAAATFLLTPVARRVAIRWQALAMPRDRDVHAVATPRMGGVALFAGFALALFLAARLPSLNRSFTNGPDMPWVVLSAAVICAVGALDDRFELDSLTKLAGQVLACGIMVTKGGVQLLLIPLGHSTVSLGRDLGIPVTILFAVLIINAMNFIDGLDGLASGVTVIAASAFFVFSFHMAKDGFADVSAAPTLLAAGLAGACAGFLPHNFWPARIFMGDSGSMVVGLVLAAAATSATTSADPQAFDSALGSLAIYLPLLIPLSVLALPFIDLLLAVVRRVRKGRSPFAPDKQHLHHRLLELGHSHRRAVLLLYFWSALVAFAGVGVSFEHEQWIVVTSLGTLGVVGVLLSVLPGLRGRGKATAGAPPTGGP
jgi:UDP-GlcNAc:undecaprenyl-phosphate/decaprenyl-phosphate GlcNAc-1-phosphate transferase